MKKKMKMHWAILLVAALALGLGVYWLSMRRCVVHQTPGIEGNQEFACQCCSNGPCDGTCDCMEKMGYCNCGQKADQYE
jgi:hypothetical protein